MPPDLTCEWISATSATTRSDFDALVACGVSSRWLWSGPMRFGIARIKEHEVGGTYEPNPDGAPAFISPAIPHDATECVVEEYDPSDLIAFRLGKPEQWWTRFGSAQFLNPEAIERAAYSKTPLPIWRTPLNWLRAQGTGTVVLDRYANLRLHLGAVREVIAEDVELGEQIDRRLRLPVPQTRVLVRRERIAA